jgi:molybdopterin/thiamine biosynthesis adenylyltransferase
MADMYLHEAIYRGRDNIEALASKSIVICGAGALGSLMTDNLIRQGFRKLTVVDFDRIELHNTGTQLYGKGDVGALKVDVLKALCFRSTGIEITTQGKRIEERTVKKYLADSDLVIDTLDNAESRRLVTDYCARNNLECLHLGMNADFGQVHWNEGYRVPNDVVEGDVCDYPLARNLILTIVAVGTETLLRYVLEGKKENYSITLRDLRINLEVD